MVVTLKSALAAAVTLSLLLLLFADAAPAAAVPELVVKAAEKQPRSYGGSKWVGIWASMPQLTESGNLPPGEFTTSSSVFTNSSVRSTICITLSAPTIRLQISNAFGGSHLPVTAATIARPVNNSAGVSAVEPSTITPLTFSRGEATGFLIPNGAVALSDPIDFEVEAGDNLAVTLYLEDGQEGNEVTSHPGSRTDSYFARGNWVDAEDFPADAGSAAHWYFISAVEGWVSSSSSAVAVIGDSITDGRGSTTNGNDRWPDQLASRMRDAGGLAGKIAVLNQAAGGNRILNDGLGPNALGRIGRDVIAQTGVKYAIILEGVNDLGTAASDSDSQEAVGDDIIAAYEQIITRLHSFDMPIFGGTITPCSGPGQSYGDGHRDKTRRRLNEWIRSSGRFDGVIDFDAAVRDPKNDSMLLTEYDDGDYLHLSPAGYKVMAEAVDLGLFSWFRNGPQSTFE